MDGVIFSIATKIVTFVQNKLHFNLWNLTLSLKKLFFFFKIRCGSRAVRVDLDEDPAARLAQVKGIHYQNWPQLPEEANLIFIIKIAKICTTSNQLGTYYTAQTCIDLKWKTKALSHKRKNLVYQWSCTHPVKHNRNMHVENCGRFCIRGPFVGRAKENLVSLVSIHVSTEFPDFFGWLTKQTIHVKANSSSTEKLQQRLQLVKQIYEVTQLYSQRDWKLWVKGSTLMAWKEPTRYPI